jgi:hypothetical protein
VRWGAAIQGLARSALKFTINVSREFRGEISRIPYMVVIIHTRTRQGNGAGEAGKTLIGRRGSGRREASLEMQVNGCRD